MSPLFHSLKEYLEYLDRDFGCADRYLPMPQYMRCAESYAVVITAHPEMINEIPQRYRTKKLIALAEDLLQKKERELKAQICDLEQKLVRVIRAKSDFQPKYDEFMMAAK